MNNNNSFNFDDVINDIKKWDEKRKTNIQIYIEYTKLIKFMEQVLLVSSGIEKIKIQNQINILKKLRKKYHVSKNLEVKINNKSKILTLKKDKV